MHQHLIEEDGELVEVVPFCSDACHRDWCASQNVKYEGWFGCQEGGDSQEFCASCGVDCGGGSEENEPC